MSSKATPGQHVPDARRLHDIRDAYDGLPGTIKTGQATRDISVTIDVSQGAQAKVPKVRRRWVALAAAIVFLLATLRLLYQPLTLESYRALDPQTLVVVGFGAPNAWTRVSNVSETPSTVSVSADRFTFQLPLPGTAIGATIEVEVRLEAPLAGRTVIDASTGQEVPPQVRGSG